MKIVDTKLNDLFKIASIIISELEDRSEESENFGFNQILKEVDKVILKQVKSIPFDALLSLRKRYQSEEHLYKFIKIGMLENIDAVVEDVKTSRNFDEAGENSNLLFDVSGSLTESHWNTLFDSFITNGQLHHSWKCTSVFCDLFNKSIASYNINISQDWNVFREKLNKLKNNDNITRLKEVIDSHFNRQVGVLSEVILN